MSPNTQAPDVEPPSVLLAFIHDEPTLPERLALSQGTKQAQKERLKKIEREISNLVGILEPQGKPLPGLSAASK